MLCLIAKSSQTNEDNHDKKAIKINKYLRLITNSLIDYIDFYVDY